MADLEDAGCGREICYEVALADFRHVAAEIEALAAPKMREPAHRTASPEGPGDAWSGRGPGTSGTRWARKKVAEVEAAAVRRGARGAEGWRTCGLTLDKLDGILQEVKLQNSTKDRELQALWTACCDGEGHPPDPGRTGLPSLPAFLPACYPPL